MPTPSPSLPEPSPQPQSTLGEDPINHPKHYRADTVYETIRVIEAWELNFCLGNTVKYISRAGRKDSYLDDLKKARWYLDRAIQQVEAASAPPTP